MKAMKLPVRRPLAAAVALAVAGGAACALAQDIRIEVTGSNIKRVEGEGALPVTILRREDIERTGATNAMEVLNYVSSNNSAGNVSISNVIGATTFSAQTASLRGLGGGRTLVLVNGKRLVTFSGEVNGVAGVNLDAIPFAAIERVEILTDGASAIYGSDAIAGVINFILRQDYQGFEGTAYYGAPTRSGGGEIAQLRATGGWGDLAKERWNVLFSASYEDQKNLLQRDRNFSNTSFRPDIGLAAFSGNTFPGHVSTAGIGVPSFPNCAPSVYYGPEFDDLIGARCYYDPAMDLAQAIPDTERTNLFASGRFQITKDWQAYASAMWSRTEVRFKIQPVPLSDQFAIPANNPIAPQYNFVSRFLLPPTSPFYPTALAEAAGVAGEPLNIRYRAVENGLRDTTDINEQWQVVAGLKGTAFNWDFDGSFYYNKAENEEKLNGGFPLLSQILPLLNSGRVNPFALNTPEIQQEIVATNYNGGTFEGESRSYGVEAKGSGEIFKLPAGGLALALGFDVRKEELKETPSATLSTGDISGYGGNFLPIEQDRDIWAIFAELNIPIHRTLEANLAVRHDDYSDFGGTTNPKVSLRWQPVREVLVRASYGKGFLAPSLFQLYNPNVQGVSTTGLSDPLRCPVTQDTNDCTTQFTVTFGGNPLLKPERSEQGTIGIIWEPSNVVSVGIDYFRLNVDDLISTGITPSAVLGDLAQFGHLVTRGPVQPQFPNLPGPITNIDQRFINLGQVKIQGWDLDLRITPPPTPIGRFRIALNGTYLEKYDVQNPVDGTFAGIVGNMLNAPASGIIPRWKHYATLTWDHGPWSATLANTHQSSYIDWSPDFDGNLRRVSTLDLWDVQASYSGFRNWKFALGVKNVFDRNPPATNQQTTFQPGYDPSYYDARARFVYGSVTYTFAR